MNAPQPSLVEMMKPKYRKLFTYSIVCPLHVRRGFAGATAVWISIAFVFLPLTGRILSSENLSDGSVSI